MDIEKLPHTNLTLIGMPAVGKSTVGVLLAKRIGYAFTDTDLLIQTGEEVSLKRIIHDRGREEFCDIEAGYVQGLSIRHTVIATGGSVIYRPDAMAHLTKLGPIIFLDIQVEALLQRLKQVDNRGVIRKPGQTIEQLFAERTPLYRKYAKFTVDSSHCTPEEVVNKIIAAIS